MKKNTTKKVPSQTKLKSVPPIAPSEATTKWERAGFSSIDEAVRGGAYSPTIKRPLRSDYEHFETVKPKFGLAQTIKSFDDEGYKKAMQEHWASDAESRKEFKHDVLHECEIPLDHPKADVFWNLAWDRGHSSGLHDVLSEARELSQLMTKVIAR